MNNNRNNNNRRRGRGNNRQQGGGQPLNRIDSRARGNAPQMLDKYKKLAHDAHLNGDRVQAEYYLQFADHYFRVIADTRSRQEEQRARRDDRGDGPDDDRDEDSEYGADSEMSVFEQPYPRETRRDDQRTNQRDAREQGRDGDGRDRDNHERDNRDRDNRERDTRSRNDRGPRRERGESAPVRDDADGEGEARANEDAAPAGGNPFTRDNRTTRGLRPRRNAPRADEGADEDGGEAGGLDPSLLPPAISESRDAAREEAAEAPAPRKRGRPRKTPVSDDGAGPLEAVNG